MESLSQDSTQTIKLAQARAEVTCSAQTHIPLLPAKKDRVIFALEKIVCQLNKPIRR